MSAGSRPRSVIAKPRTLGFARAKFYARARRLKRREREIANCGVFTDGRSTPAGRRRCIHYRCTRHRAKAPKYLWFINIIHLNVGIITRGLPVWWGKHSGAVTAMLLRRRRRYRRRRRVKAIDDGQVRAHSRYWRARKALHTTNDNNVLSAAASNFTTGQW